MDEAEGSTVLEAVFRDAGLRVERDHPFTEGGLHVVLDGFDVDRRVGFEFITTEAGDRAEFTPEVIAALEARMQQGELFLLLVDECDIPDADTLRFAARAFLATLHDRGYLP